MGFSELSGQCQKLVLYYQLSSRHCFRFFPTPFLWPQMWLCGVPSQLAVKPISHPTEIGFGPLTHFGQWHVNGCDTSEDLKHTSGLALLLLTLLSSPQEKHVPASLLVQEMWSRPASDLQLEERCSQPQATPTDQTPRWHHCCLNHWLLEGLVTQLKLSDKLRSLHLWWMTDKAP